ncbi:PREDICTED: uncharacterized protein LOC109341529 [Lupinus angustifolius]|uniref:uncharacterized protein LOC109341529 n=1 Tax=Lupinus angustifolius TaxID=3871 RepID=UPI00092EECD2|nr:PREDICTED: uncharacterized protein LOC109341529 [Lupinus angustifolius]
MAAMTVAIQGVNANLHQLNQQQHHAQSSQGSTQYKGLDELCHRQPPRFEGGLAPEAANEWIQELEKIFRALMCSDEHKVTYATYMLSKEADNWWEFTRRHMEHQVVSWTTFKDKFLQNYFPADMKTRKEMEFLKLQQGSLSMGEYAAKFEELARYAPHYNEIGKERSKCAKFEDGLKPDLKVGHYKSSFQKLKREAVNSVQAARPRAQGRVFTMSGTEVGANEDLIQALPVVSLPYDLLVSTPTSEPVIVSTLDIILGMDWLSRNHVLLNCFSKTVVFSEPIETSKPNYEAKNTSANEMEKLLKNGAQDGTVGANRVEEAVGRSAAEAICQT